MSVWPRAALLAPAAVLVLLCVLQPEAYGLLLSFCMRLAAWASLVAIALVALFCVSVLSLDVAYLFVRLGLPEADVWTEAARPRWVLAWTATWLLQLTFWTRALPTTSLLYVHELANFALTLYHLVLKYVAPLVCTQSFPSASLVASVDALQHSSIVSALVARASLPLLYILCHGLPAEWRFILTLFVLDVAPVTCACVALRTGLLREESQVARLHWSLRYPVPHCFENDGLKDDDECEVHGTCSICLSSLCCSSGGVATAVLSRALSEQVAPGIAALRRSQSRIRGHLLRGLAGRPSLSVARIPAERVGNGRIATTNCGHSFHSACLASAARSLPRCPHCRASLHKTRAPDEETVDQQMSYLLVGFIQGFSLLGTQWSLLALQSRKAAVA